MRTRGEPLLCLTVSSVPIQRPLVRVPKVDGWVLEILKAGMSLEVARLNSRKTRGNQSLMHRDQARARQTIKQSSTWLQWLPRLGSMLMVLVSWAHCFIIPQKTFRVRGVFECSGTHSPRAHILRKQWKRGNRLSLFQTSNQCTPPRAVKICCL